MTKQQIKDRGFTIIEVVLVLAIAALIFLMVFIALPALQASQRDTARKSDVSIVSAAYNSAVGSNRGTTSVDSGVLRRFVNGVSDNTDITKVLAAYTSKEGYNPVIATDGEEALKLFDEISPSAVLLDVMMPKMNGYEVVKNLRANKNETAVLMLTARDGIDEKIKGLDLGADDYLVKPFDFRELIARIRALVRRKYGNISNELQIDDLIVDISKKSVTRAGKNIELTGKEYEVLEYLIQNKGRVLSRDKIRDGVWDYAYEGESNIIDVLIKNIRKKIDIGDSKPIIHTKRGLGYVLKEDE